MITAVIDGSIYRIDDEDPKVFFNNGGEADLYRFTPNQNFYDAHGRKPYVIKIFREETEAERQSAIERQTKLPGFPTNLPKRVVDPAILATNLSGKIIGYVMELIPGAVQLIEFKTVPFRQKHNVTVHQLLTVLRNLHSLISEIHAAGLVVGDLNDKNFLVTSSLEVFAIDADSMQYGDWDTQAYVLDFVDPLICKPGNPARPRTLLNLRKVGKHTQSTDWYAFAVIVFNLLALIHPYMGGTHRPPRGGRLIRAQRIHGRITAFNPQVQLPAMETAIPYASWPIELLQCFRLIFEGNKRGIFPLALLEDSFWITCNGCKTVHGRTKCPTCGVPGRHARSQTPSAPFAAPTAVATPRPAPRAPAADGSFRTTGSILAAAYQGDRVRYVYHEDGAYRREDGAPILAQPHDPRLTVLVAGSRTVFCANRDFVISNGHVRNTRRHATHRLYNRTTVATNSSHVYWVSKNSLVRDDGRGTVQIGTVGANMTSVWTGEKFGVAMVRAGFITQVFTFGAEATSFSGSYTLPLEFGNLVDAHCVINNEYAWLTVTVTKQNGTTVNTAYVFDAKAQLRAISSARQGYSAWPGVLNRSAVPYEDKLLVPVAGTGIVQVGIQGRDLVAEGVRRNTQHQVPQQGLVALCATPKGILLATNRAISPVAPME